LATLTFTHPSSPPESSTLIIADQGLIWKP